MKKVVNIIACLFLALFALRLIWAYRTDGYSNVRKLSRESTFAVITEEKVPREAIAAKAETDKFLYLLYENCGLVNIYSSGGVFQYGIQVTAGSNGRGDIAVKDGILFIKPRENVIYLFNGTSLVGQCRYSHSNYTAGNHEYMDLEKEMATAKAKSNDRKYCISDDAWMLLYADTDKPVQFLPQKKKDENIVKLCIGLGILCIIFMMDSQSIKRRFKTTKKTKNLGTDSSGNRSKPQD